MVQLLYEKWAHPLKFANSRFKAANLRVFAAAIAAAGSPINRCTGFIDGTLRPTCRPIRMQRAIYNGHKRVHELKFQAIMISTSVLTKVPEGIFPWNFPGIFRNFSIEFSRNFPKISNVLKRGDPIRNLTVVGSGVGVYKFFRHFHSLLFSCLWAADAHLMPR
jgi:hypothetical protein